MIVEGQVFVDLNEFIKRAQPRRQRLDVLQRQPVLVQLLVHPVQVRHQALVLLPELVDLLLHTRPLLQNPVVDLLVATSLLPQFVDLALQLVDDLHEVLLLGGVEGRNLGHVVLEFLFEHVHLVDEKCLFGCLDVCLFLHELLFGFLLEVS